MVFPPPTYGKLIFSRAANFCNTKKHSLWVSGSLYGSYAIIGALQSFSIREAASVSILR